MTRFCFVSSLLFLSVNLLAQETRNHITDPNSLEGNQILPEEYCNNFYSTSTFEWIESIEIGSLTNQTGNNGGYVDFSDVVFDVTVGEPVAVNFQTGYHEGGDYDEYWSVFCDLNSDFDFDDEGELLFRKKGAHSVSGELTIPFGTIAGEKRFRVMMAFGFFTEGCTQFFYGEAEDYSFSVKSNSNCQALKEDWNLTDIGEENLPNSACFEFNSITHYLESSSAGLGDFEDDLFFVHKELCGVGVVTAKILGINEEDPNAYAGLMMRDNTSDNSKHIAIGFHSTEGYLLQTRLLQSYPTYQHPDRPLGYPYWIRIERTEDTFKAYNSLDGENWEMTHDVNLLKMGACIEVGLFATSSLDEVYNESQFQFVSIKDEADLLVEVSPEYNYIAVEEELENLALNGLSSSAEIFHVEYEKDTEDLFLYPNPATDYLKISINNNADDDARMSIYNSLGIKVYSKELELTHDTDLTLNLKELGLKNGKYFLTLIRNNKRIQTQAFAIEDKK